MVQSDNEAQKSKIENNSQQKVFYLDVLRLVACMSVVMIHSSMRYASGEVGTTNFWAGIFFDSIARAGVPLFVMISGALMLDEDYVLTKQKWIKHISKMVVFFVSWSIIYCIVFKVFLAGVIENEEISFARVLKSLVNGHYHLWFVPMIVGLYLVLPLLRLWIRRTNMRLIEYYIVLSVAFAFVIPHALKLLGIIHPLFKEISIFGNAGMEYCDGYATYFVLGWYLNNRKLNNSRIFGLMGLGAALVTILGTFCVFAWTEITDFIFYNDFSVNVLVYSVSIFVLCKEKWKDTQYADTLLHKMVSIITKNSLGIYAVHAAIVSLLSKILAPVHGIIAVPIVFGLSALLSTAASIVLRKVPILKRLV